MSLSRSAFFAQYQNFEAVQARYGVSYHIATRLLPRRERVAVYTLYTWFRVPDEIVDNAYLLEEPADVVLEYWIKAWWSAYQTGESEYPVLAETAQIFREYNIPHEYAEKFLYAMLQDLHKTRYATYEELEDYMHGSAAVVGLILTHILGGTEASRTPAVQLGYAMQLTNFIRDIEEDYQQRDRIYLPQSNMHQHGITDDDIAGGNSAALKPLLAQYDGRVSDLYLEAIKGVRHLRTGKLGVVVAAYLYWGILQKIRRSGYNVFAKRAKTNSVDKTVLIFRAVWFQIKSR
jgi:phytoene synthase